MDDFKPLSPLLKDYYHLDLGHLPQELQERIGDALSPMSWGRLSPEQRQSRAESWDYENDPATEPERQKTEKLVDDLFEIERKITQWKSVATPTAQDLATQERTLEELEKRHAELEIEYRKMRGDYCGDYLEQKAPLQREPYDTRPINQAAQEPALPLIDTKAVIREEGKRNATLQHTDRNRLYGEVREEVRQLWKNGDPRLHSDMANYFKAKEKYSHLGIEKLRKNLIALANEINRPDLIKGTKK